MAKNSRTLPALHNVARGRHYTDGEKAAIERVRADVANLMGGLLAFVNGGPAPTGATVLGEPAVDWNITELRDDLRRQLVNVQRGDRPCPGAVNVTLTYYPEGGPGRVMVQVVDDLHDLYQWTLLEGWRLGITTRLRRCEGCAHFFLLRRASHRAQHSTCGARCRKRVSLARQEARRERARVRARAERANLKPHRSGHYASH